MRTFFKCLFGYYKWHIFFLILITICVGFVFSNLTYERDPDLSLAYVGKNYINVQTFKDSKESIELLLHDVNGDGEKVASMAAYAVDLESDLHDVFEKLIEKNSYHIFIAEKESFTGYDDKSIFTTVTDYAILKEEFFEVLKDDSGRAYAVSLEDNDFIKTLGIVDETNLYIAAVNPKEGKKLTDRYKNGRNIAGYILTQE